MDNYYNSPRLAQALLDKGISCFGTWKSNMGVPDILKIPKLQGKKLQAARNNKPNIAVCDSVTINGETFSIPIMAGASFYCNSAVTMIYTIDFDMSERVAGGLKQKLKYLIQHEYNGKMNGVDLFDQLMASFSTYIRSIKWWKRVFHWTFYAASVNSYICFKEFNPQIKHREYVENIAIQLLELVVDWESRAESECDAEPPIINPPRTTWYFTKTNKKTDLRLTGVHKKQKIEISKRYVVSWLGGGRKRATIFCPTCQKSLCGEDHWNIFHTVEDLFHQ